MRTIMSKTPHDSSFSFSRRHFRWTLKKGGGSSSGAGGAEADEKRHEDEEEHEEEEAETLPSSDCPSTTPAATVKKRATRAAAAAAAVSRFRAAVLSALLRSSGRLGGSGALGSRLTGTLFGHRRGHVHFAFQVDPKSPPVLLIELATPTSGLVREMASGLVRIALECEKKDRDKSSAGAGAGAAVKLLEEPLWRTYCNGRKCGYAVRRECGPADWKVLRAVEPVSMGAGVLPAATVASPGGTANAASTAADGEMMYMRGRFERVVGSRDSEAFYMMSPDGNGGPELSIYLLRL